MIFWVIYGAALVVWNIIDICRGWHVEFSTVMLVLSVAIIAVNLFLIATDPKR